MKIISKKLGKLVSEMECDSYATARTRLASLAAAAVQENIGFVFMEDVGASKAAIKFNNGLTVTVK